MVSIESHFLKPHGTGQQKLSFAGYSKMPLGIGVKPAEIPIKKRRQRRRQEMPAPRFLSRAQAAAYLGVSEHIFAMEVQYGRWPKPVPDCLGRKSRWDIRALDRRADELSALTRREDLANGFLTDAEERAMALILGGTR